MKKSNIVSIIVAALALLAIVATLCVYMKQIRQLLSDLLEKLQEKHADLRIYMD